MPWARRGARPPLESGQCCPRVLFGGYLKQSVGWLNLTQSVATTTANVCGSGVGGEGKSYTYFRTTLLSSELPNTDTMCYFLFKTNNKICLIIHTLCICIMKV